MNGIKSFLRSKTIFDVQWAFWSIISSAFTYFVLRVIIGRALGPEALGVYTIIFTIYQFGLQFASFGIGAALTKYIAEHPDLRGVTQHISSGVIGSIVFGLVSGSILFVLSSIIAKIFNIPELEPLLIITAFCFPFIAIQVTVLGVYNGMRRMKTFAFLSITLNILILFISIILVYAYNLALIGAVLGFVIPVCTIGVLSIYLLIKESLLEISLFKCNVLRNLLHFGFFFILSTSSSFLNTYIGTILIAYFLTATEVGIYSVAITLSQVLTVIPSAVQRITTPATAVAYAKKGGKETRMIIIKSTKYSLLFTMVLGLCLAVSGPWVLSFFFSEEFLPAYQPLILLIIGNIILTPVIANGACLFSIGKITVPYRANLFFIAITICLDILLIPTFGVLGAAFATLSAQLFMLIITLKLIWKYTSTIPPNYQLS